MNNKKNRSYIITLMTLLILILAGCSSDKETSIDEILEPVVISVERTGNLITGIGKVKVYVDGEKVMQVKNNETESIELLLSPGIHTIQMKGQGDKSSKVEFEVATGQDSTFGYRTEISNVYGVKLDRIR